MALCYVDDLLLAAPSGQLHKMKDDIFKLYKCKESTQYDMKDGAKQITFLGSTITYLKNKYVRIGQDKLVKKIGETFDVSRNLKIKSPIYGENEKAEGDVAPVYQGVVTTSNFRSVVGMLMFCATTSRADLRF
jgi:hypothetical protein